MNPVRTRIPQPPALAAPSPRPMPKRLSLGLAALLVTLTASLLAALAALGLEAGFGAAAPWAALGGALLGVVAAALPLSMLALRPGVAAVPAAAPSGDASVPIPGAVTPRALFVDWAEREWSRSRRYGTAAALLLVEVDRFGHLCDTRGAHAGDAVLAELLRQTQATLRGADMLTRFSDGQMAVFLAQADATGALDVAERIRECAERLDLELDDQPLRVTVSVGVAHLRPAHPSLHALIEDAQDALAAARQAGSNCVRTTPFEIERPRRPGTGQDDRRTPRQQPRP